MASLGSGGEGGGREELKSQFSTREGTYRLASAVEFARSARPLTYVTPGNNTAPVPGCSPPVRISFVKHSSNLEPSRSNHDRSSPVESPVSASNQRNNDAYYGNGSASNGSHEDSNLDLESVSTPTRFCLNIGKELFVYPYLGVKKAVDMSKPIDKRIYKGTNPTCHDFNPLVASHDSLMLLIGFSGGQIQLVNPISKEVNKLYNEERMIDKTRVTCVRWANSTTLFLASHASGHMYLYNVDNPSGTGPPNYQLHKTGRGFTIYNCKSKVPRNPLNRWTLGDGAINEFAFSPCGLYLAAVSQDGFLRIFRYENFELVGLTRSYFGGLLCVCWSSDSKYICVGGEDDLVTMWGFKERRVVARGQGHKSWVSVVAFDPVTSTFDECDESEEKETNCSCSNGDKCTASNDCQSSGVFSCDSADTDSPSNSCAACKQLNGVKQLSVNHINNNPSSTRVSISTNNTPHTCAPQFPRHPRHSRATDSMRLSVSEPSRIPVCYRIGSVGQDTQLCLWDLTEDVLKQPFGKPRPVSRTPGKNHSDTNSSVIHSNSKYCNSNQNNLPNHANSCKSHNEKEDGLPNNTSAFSSSGSNSSGLVNNVNASSTVSANTNGLSQTNSNSSSGLGLLSLRFGFGNNSSSDKEKAKEKDTGKEHKRNFSLGSSTSKSDKTSATPKPIVGPSTGFTALGINNAEDPFKIAVRLDDCPLLEPLICKKISHERLTSLIFREESIVTACQDGILCTWARPGDAVSQL